MVHKYSVKLVVSENPEEDVVWTEHVAPVLKGLPDNVLRICYHGFTEMFNNVIDHSDSETAEIEVLYVEAGMVHLTIADRGVGIFNKVAKALRLSNRYQAILELSKGKLTTDPHRHSGEGIFSLKSLRPVRHSLQGAGLRP